jgi:hypothetical protein
MQPCAKTGEVEIRDLHPIHYIPQNPSSPRSKNIKNAKKGKVKLGTVENDRHS